MGKWSKKVMAAVLAAAMVVGLTACGTKVGESSSQTDAASKEQQASSVESKDNNGKVTLKMSWWGGDSRHEATLKAIEAFEKKYPNIKVEAQYGAWGGWLDQLSVQMAGGTEPDVVQINWNWIYEFSKDGNGFADLNQYGDTVDLTQYPESLLEQMTIDGKLQGIPVSSTGKVFYWNKTTFDKAGIAVPSSFKEMIEAGKVFQEKLGEDYYPMALTPYEQMLVMVYYLQQKYDKQWIMDQKVNFTEDEVAEGIAFIRMLEDSHVFPSQEQLAGDGADTMDKNPNWINGKYAGFYEWDSSQAKFANALDEGQEFVMGGYPYDYGDVKAATVKIAMAFAVSANSKHPKEAAMLIDYLLNDSEGVEIMALERGVVSNENARTLLESKGMLSDLTYESNVAAMENAGFALDPYFEDVKLKDNTGLYFEIFEDLSYDNMDAHELAGRLIDGINEVQDSNK
ncbi:ABC transporter substrate-binding protein [Hungatella effluvii]|uniref:ABC transporter substrate-binding protein n=1 Tax=Hungatella effluvii TaxID=1096246 RepID=UPI0022E847AC|nr:ABC transporter substrate-binding protein [Hungatella effluvii]